MVKRHRIVSLVVGFTIAIAGLSVPAWLAEANTDAIYNFLQ